jgi:hypothetical protein
MSVPIEMIIFDELVNQDTPEIEENKILSHRGFYWAEKNGIRVLACELLEKLGFINGFSTRLGGVSPFPKNDLNLAGFDEDSPENIMENRRRFLSVFAADYTLSTVWQVHGDSVRIIRNLEEAKDGNFRADAIVSDLDGILLGIKTADCVPILLADAKSHCFAAVHAGWRGTLQKIAMRTLEIMSKTYGSDVSDIVCALGPAAVSRYEVGEDVINQFRNEFREEADEILRPSSNSNHAFLNLHIANVKLLLKCGISQNNIRVAPFCTMQRNDLFFSYRLEKKKLGKVGRLLSVIGKARGNQAQNC